MISLMVSCKNEIDEPISKPTNVAQNLVGSWLLSTSDADNWIAYEFTETSRLNVEMIQSKYPLSGNGTYSVDETNATVTGGYTDNRHQTFYIDWIVNNSTVFQIDFKLYDSQTYVGDASIYRIVGNVDVDADAIIQPQYRSFTGQSDNSSFRALDSEIIEIDSTSGEIKGLREGVTFVTLRTPVGTAAIKVNVTSKQKNLQELILGTWIYDNRNEHEWQRTIFYDNDSVSVEWARDDIDVIHGYGSGKYEVADNIVKFAIYAADGTRISQEWRVESIDDFEWSYNAYNDNSFVGKYTGHKRLYSVTLSPEGTSMPEYQSLVGNAEIQGYKSHNDAIATVSDFGEITAKSIGRTYIDVNTNKGAGVVEVNVSGGAIPVTFEDCIGKSVSTVYEILGDKPFNESDAMIIYLNYSPEIDMIGISLDSLTRLVRGISITYNSSVNISQVTSILDATFIPYTSQTTDTYKAYMDTSERADASVGVTWDIPKLTLVYVNLATDLFADYSFLLGLYKEDVLKRMGREPDSIGDQSQNWLFLDNKGIIMVSTYYTDFVNNYDDVRSVVTMLDESLSEEQITTYLKKKYPYYPEYSSDEELVFIPKGHAMEIYYQPRLKMIMYISTVTSSKSNSKVSINKLKMAAKSINR